ncbi:hypothetical protein EVAR_65416_1 [Eumeta japonica]|uniref:Uncharacterized protein n=1 Tax=Eumeta variegata TaxID=151549 RepID=A0A4C1YLB8_EUMVA|nr:hypothetical protein EVAR_65416_1 [Eumeta japonica]
MRRGELRRHAKPIMPIFYYGKLSQDMILQDEELTKRILRDVGIFWETAAETRVRQRGERTRSTLPERVASTAPNNGKKCNTHAVPTFTHILAHEHFIKII